MEEKKEKEAKETKEEIAQRYMRYIDDFFQKYFLLIEFVVWFVFVVFIGVSLAQKKKEINAGYLMKLRSKTSNEPANRYWNEVRVNSNFVL